MGFEPDERLRGLLGVARELVDEGAIPLEAAFLRQDWAVVDAGMAALRERARASGLWTPQLHVGDGGLGLSLVEHGALCEELGRSILGFGVVNAQAPDAGNMELLAQFASPAQRQRFLEPLAAGRIRSCFAMTEPEHAGANPLHMSTRAVADGDDWVLDGHKWFTTAADGADFAVVMAVTHPDAPAYARASMILVPLDTPGFEIVRNISVMGEVGHGAASHAEVRFTACRVPRSNTLGQPQMGFAMAQERLGPGRIHHCMRWVGISVRALDLMCRRAVERELAPGKPLATRQQVQFWIAESRAEIDAARLMVLETAARIDAHGQRAARVDISVIKFFVAGVLQRVLDRAIQVHGALGMTDDTPLAWWFRHERAARIYDGPDEVHKELVARKILEGYGLKRPRS